MSDADILSQLTTLFRRVFENPGIELRAGDTAEDIPGWDSMAQVTLAIEIEQTFDVRIKSAEMEAVRNIEDLAALIKDRLPATA